MLKILSNHRSAFSKSAYFSVALDPVLFSGKNSRTIFDLCFLMLENELSNFYVRKFSKVEPFLEPNMDDIDTCNSGIDDTMMNIYRRIQRNGKVCTFKNAER